MRMLWACLVTLIVCGEAAGFDGKEHRRVSGNGLLIAMRACENTDACRPLSGLRQAVQPTLTKDLAQGYGQLVSSIDYRLDPLHVLEQEGTLASMPDGEKPLLDYVLRELHKPGFLFLRAAAANDTHFQSELLTSLRHWHEYAVKLAAQSRQKDRETGDVVDTPEAGTLFVALVVNSFGDHFLQDFFAPGHIITPRYGLHDAVALGIHNLRNLTGTTFVVDRDAFIHDLQPLLEHIAHAEFKTQEAAKEINELAVKWKTTPPAEIELWGDSKLDESPEQELLMTLIAARFVLDVFESYNEGKEINSFRNLAWTPMLLGVPYEGPIDPRAQEVIERCGRKVQIMATGAITYGKHEIPCSAQGRLAFPRIVGITLASENGVFNGRNTSRVVPEIDVLLFGLPPLRPRGNRLVPASAFQWGVTAGYSWVFSEEARARGFTYRLLYA